MFHIVEYLKEPLNHTNLKKIFSMLNMRPCQVIRKNEVEFKDNNLKDYLEDDNTMIEMIIKYPKILERPIIIIGDKAIMGRPPENIYEII